MLGKPDHVLLSAQPHIRGYAVGFDLDGKLVIRDTTDELDLPEAGRRRLAAELRRCAERLERGGADLH